MFKERQVIKELLQVLYATEEDGKIVVDDDKEWDSETIAIVAEVLRNHGYFPQGAVSMTPEEEISIVWCAEDVMSHAENHGQEINKEEAIEIIEIADRRHDCCHGISWDTLDCHIDMFIDDRGEKPEHPATVDEIDPVFPEGYELD